MEYKTSIYYGPDFVLENGYRENPDSTITEIREYFDSPRREITRTRTEMANHLRVIRQNRRERRAQLARRGTRRAKVFDYRPAAERRRASKGAQTLTQLIPAWERVIKENT
jgi:hypothetical protein